LKRVLVYGFGPYKQFDSNITAHIVKAIPNSRPLKRIVFPVRFDRGQFIRALTKHRPQIVLGLGQSSRRRIHIEARAANRRRASKQALPRPILKDGPISLPTTLPLQLARGVLRSTNAGDYVCNYSMYVLLEHIHRTGLPTRFGFIHIPYNYSRRQASRYVLAVLKKLTAGDQRRGSRNSIA
jgi:pyrrolidone-carboxylate peptidase